MTLQLPRPVGRQKEVLCLPPSGHTVVLGTAGSGKTTLAIHRAVYLANPATDHGGRTLLLTFNRCLVAYLKALGGRLGQVDVHNYHQFARGYLNLRGKMGRGSICDTDLMATCCREAARSVKVNIRNPILERPIEFLIEEFRWLSQNGIRTLDDYFKADDVGRAGSRVLSDDRAVAFLVYERYLEIRNSRGKLYDWDDLAQTVLSEFQTDSGERSLHACDHRRGAGLLPCHDSLLGSRDSGRRKLYVLWRHGTADLRQQDLMAHRRPVCKPRRHLEVRGELSQYKADRAARLSHCADATLQRRRRPRRTEVLQPTAPYRLW